MHIFELTPNQITLCVSKSAVHLVNLTYCWVSKGGRHHIVFDKRIYLHECPNSKAYPTALRSPKKEKKKKISLQKNFKFPPMFASPALKIKIKKIKKRKLSINDDIRDCSSHS